MATTRSKQPPKGDAFTDPAANVYTGVHRVLSWGMYASTGVYALGVLRALQHPTYISLAHAPGISFAGTLTGLAHLTPASLMILATVLLILTPVIRVAVALGAFWLDHDPRFVVVTGTVFAIIMLTVVLGVLGLH